MSQYDFDKLVEKFLDGTASLEEEKLMRDWAAHMLEQSSTVLSASEKQVVQSRLWKRIRVNTLGRQPFLVRHGWLNSLAIAASIILLLWAGVFVFKHPATTKSTKIISQRKTELPGTITVKNTSDKPQNIHLKDGSLVTLSAKSSLSYPDQYGVKNREIYLYGEALFDVVKDPARPFIVHTGKLITQVLGTSFIVKSYDQDKAIEVLVKRGKVSVYDASEKLGGSRNGLILMPNQKITFDKVSQKFTPGLVEAPQLIQSVEHKASFVFDKAPLAQVMATLSKAYGIEFIIENQALNHCVFNGDLADLPLFMQLDLVCKSLNAHYERRGTTVFINGEGCSD